MPRGKLENITRELLAPLWEGTHMSADRIGEALGVTGAGIRYKAKALGLKPRGRSRECMAKMPDAEFTRLWNAGVPVAEIQRRAGYSSVKAVSTRRMLLGLPVRVRKPGSGRHAGWATQDDTDPQDLFRERWEASRQRERHLEKVLLQREREAQGGHA